MQCSEFAGKKLGFDLIRAALESKTVSPEAKAFAAGLIPVTDAVFIRLELKRVLEFKTLIDTGADFEPGLPYSLQPLLERSAITGNWLSAEELLRLLRWLRLLRGTQRQLKEKKQQCPLLFEMISVGEVNTRLIPLLEGIVDDTGAVKDSASPALKQLRQEQVRVAAELRKVLNKVLRQAKKEGWSGDGEITVRNDRLVIPLNADFKGRIPGFVQDISHSGQTIFLEPSEALEHNNHLRRLQAEEKNEMIRILTGATAEIGKESAPLLVFAAVMTQLDFIRAKALLAVRLGASLPYVRGAKEDGFLLLKACHPLLLLSENKKREQVVPLTLSFSSGQRILLISGPNAGGKSVALKTVGLLQMMVQSGLLVPAREGTEFRIFRKLFVDIGDEQSIQNDLSTYTSHLKTMREMQDGMDEDSLFLIDEFGAGTDPRLGGAIAEAFLESFLSSGAWGVITTHYGNLKQFAETHNGIVNAAMQFDPQTLSPTYHIEAGIPGRSYAFEIARQVGVGEEIISRAKEKVDKTELYSEDLLLKLEAQKAELDKLLDENRRNGEELKSLVEHNKELNRKLQEKRTSILREAREQAQRLILEANARIERTIREIRESQAEKEQTRQLRKELKEMLPAIEEAGEESSPEVQEEKLVELPEARIGVGDWVKLKKGDTWGKVEEMQGKKAIVVAGQMWLTIQVKDLVKIEPPAQEAEARSSSAEVVRTKKEHISAELDVQGMRVEEALMVLSKFIDDAILAGLHELRILHGKGTGALRIAIREFLRKYPQVISLEDAPADTGGAGWTIAGLKT